MFGHSFGAIIGLEVALAYPLKKLALYEPPVTRDGSFPSSWLPDFEHALARNKPLEAAAVFVKGLRLAGPLNHAPLGVLKLLLRLTVHGTQRTVMLEGLPTVSDVG